MGQRFFNASIYLLILTVVVGAFAAIARNNYGVSLIAIGCFGLSVTILLRIFEISPIIGSTLPKIPMILEYLLMGLILILFGLRALRIRFDLVEIVFVTCSILMILTYLYFLKIIRNNYRSNKILSTGIFLLYGSIILFFTSMSMTFINYSLSVIIGSFSFLFGIGFIILHFKEGNHISFRDSETSLFKEAFQYYNLSPIILTMILLMSVYMGLHQINVLPSLYTGEVPTRYQELLDRNMKGEELGIDNQPKHEVYWNEYQSFLKFLEEREEKKKEKE